MAISKIMSQSMIMAKSSMKMAKVQNAAKKQMDGEAGVLSAEIMQDQARGADTKKKEEELAETKEKSAKVGEATMNALSELNEDMRQASKADADNSRTEETLERKEGDKEMSVSVNSVTSTANAIDSYSKVQNKATEKEKQTNNAESGVTYEKGTQNENATYSIKKMSQSERASLVQKLKLEADSKKEQFLSIVSKSINGQGGAYAKAVGDDNFWEMLSGGNLTVDPLTKLQAQQDIGEDGYWGVKQTSQRLFDFAYALAGDDVEKMKEMQAAMEKGFKMAANKWGGELPGICGQTRDAANKLFDEYYKSKEAETEKIE